MTTEAMTLLPAILALAAAMQDPRPAGPVALAVAPDGTLALGGDGGVRIGDAPLGDPWVVKCLAFSRDGKRLAAGGGAAAERGDVRVWDVAARKLLWQAKEQRDLVMSVAWSADGASLFAASADKTVVRYGDGGRTAATLTGHAGPVLCVAASPDGKRVASAGADRSIRIWDASTGALERAINSHGGAVHACAWSPDGTTLATGSEDRTVRVFQPAIGRLVRIVRGHDAEVHALAWTPGGRRLWSGTADGALRAIDGSSDAIEETRRLHRDGIVGLAVVGSEILSLDASGIVRREAESPGR